MRAGRYFSPLIPNLVSDFKSVQYFLRYGPALLPAGPAMLPAGPTVLPAGPAVLPAGPAVVWAMGKKKEKKS